MKELRKDNWFKLGILIMLAIISFSIAYYYLYLSPKLKIAKENLELQAMCSKKGDEFFGDSIGRTYIVHYNRKLNKCFGLTEEYLNGDHFSNLTINLWDVYEGKAYAGW